MAFDVDRFKAHRERVVTLSDGNQVTVRRPDKRTAACIAYSVSQGLTDSARATVARLDAARGDLSTLQDDPQVDTDIAEIVLAYIAAADTEPKFVLHEAEAVDGLLWVELLRPTPDDALAIATPIWEFIADALQLPEPSAAERAQ